jgi:hypothetical protein
MCRVIGMEEEIKNKIFLREKIFYNSLVYLLIYVTSASTVDHSALLKCKIRVGF